jgi:hypothetical protein
LELNGWECLLVCVLENKNKRALKKKCGNVRGLALQCTNINLLLLPGALLLMRLMLQRATATLDSKLFSRHRMTHVMKSAVAQLMLIVPATTVYAVSLNFLSRTFI